MKFKFIILILILNSIIPLYNVNAMVSSSLEDDVISGSAIDENISGSALETLEINEVVKEDFPVQFFPQGEEIHSIDTYSYITVISADYYYYQCRIDWEDPSAIDTSTPGRKVLKGRAVPPEGYVFEYDIYAELPVIIYNSENENAEIFAPNESKTMYTDDRITLTKPNSDISEYLEDEVLLSTKSGDIFYCPVIWDNTPFADTGYYNVKGQLLLPLGIKAENSSDTVITKTFYSMKDDRIYIEPYYIVSNSIRFPWLKEIEDCERIVLQYSFDNKNWENDIEGLYGFADSAYLFISTLFMSDNKDYYFRLYYNDEYTDTIKINIGTMEIYNIEGDRDGGDNSPQNVPVPDQSSSVTGSSGHGSSNIEVFPVKEFSTANSITVSGERLKDMANTPDNKISVEKEGIEIKLPSDIIEDNNIKDDDTVTITIDQPDDNTFEVALSVDEREIKSIPGTEVFVPLKNTHLPVKINIDTSGEHTVPSEINSKDTAYTGNDTANNAVIAPKDNNTSNTGSSAIKAQDNIPEKQDTSAHFIVPALLVIITAAIFIGRKVFYGREQI